MNHPPSNPLPPKEGEEVMDLREITLEHRISMLRLKEDNHMKAKQSVAEVG